MSDTPTVVGGAPPDLGADTMDVLLEAGMTSEEIAELLASGVL
jgi:crotonobetainyl-CoA:carnitine CoA-transferase CaiB-like acyl-CoA transferase